MVRENYKRRYTEHVVEEKKIALLVYEKETKVTEYLQQRLSGVYDVYKQTDPTSGIKKVFDLVIFVNCFPQTHTEIQKQKNTVFLTFFNTPLFIERLAWCKKYLSRYKIVNIGFSGRTPHELIDFVLFKTRVPYSFDFSSPSYVPSAISSSKPFVATTYFFSFLKWVFGLVVLINVLYVVLLGSLLFLISDISQSSSITQMEKKIPLTKAVYGGAKGLSVFSRNTLFWLPSNSLSTLLDASGSTLSLIEGGMEFVDNYTAFTSLLLQKTKGPQEMAQIQLRLDAIDKNIKSLLKDTNTMRNSWVRVPAFMFEEKKKNILNQLNTANQYLTVFSGVQKNVSEFFGRDGKRRYLVLFMNNMELRPGGGFIGSVGVVDFDHYTLTQLRIYDVYSLDGQLKTHIDPPEPIRKYLSQPHWFLRDSNFSPDFPTNAVEALSFVQKEVGWSSFDGVVGVTFSAVQDMIGAFPGLTVSDYNERITSDNFFIKAEGYAEYKFFSGSHSKKNFLEAVASVMQLRIETGDFDKILLAKKLNNLLDEKFIVLHFKNQQLQDMTENNSWSGAVAQQQCKTQEKCFLDYIYVVDSNLGVNKSNFYMQRAIRLDVDITTKGEVENSLTIEYRNESSSKAQVGGEYKNYLQVILPKDIRVTDVSIDGASVGEYEVNTQDLKTVGLWVTVVPGASRSVVIEYSFVRKIDAKTTYQLIVQKQIGSINNDFIFEMSSPPAMGFVKTNFPAVVQSAKLVYNTFLEKDRLLLVSFSPDE
ncbi:MAG: DUF4012 domain-containing protein [Candidatus Roizmanbacteria bacterium]|nr:DUF4012 domain-containing protein [Candidatus Roizmanbacteria bacterium]